MVRKRMKVKSLAPSMHILHARMHAWSTEAAIFEQPLMIEITEEGRGEEKQQKYLCPLSLS